MLVRPLHTLTNRPFVFKKKSKSLKMVSMNKFGKQPTAQKREKRAAKPGTQKTVKQLLGELYADKVYLEKLLNDDSKLSNSLKNDRRAVSKHSNFV